MTRTAAKTGKPGLNLSVQVIVLSLISWAFLALLFFLLFSVTPPGESRPLWYAIGTLVFELVGFLAAALLAFRNWSNVQVVSGRSVWLAIGLGMLFYFFGSLFFGIWENYWQLEPDVSLGDLFYFCSYIALAWGMILAVTTKRLNMEVWQWGIVGAIAAAGIIFATWIASEEAEAAVVPLSTPPGQVLLAQAPADTVSPTVTPPPAPATPEASPPESGDAVESNAPEWAIALDQQLGQFVDIVAWSYIVADVVLLIIATTLLLAFWGGRFSQSWRMIAAATFCLYIADMWFQFAIKTNPNYESGELPEVFWIFSAVLFGIGAALEYDVSSRSSRRSSRRRAS